MKKKVELNIIVPLCLMVAIFLFFVIMSKGAMASSFNLGSLFDQTFITLIAGLGTIFVVATGGADMSVGTTLGISTVVAAAMITGWGFPDWLFFILVPVIGAVQGLLNGFLVTRLRVPSFMTTLAMLIGIRGLINYIQSTEGLFYATKTIQVLGKTYIKIPALIILVAFAYYLLEYTKFGESCKAIGENENVAISIGLPVKAIKMKAFLLSSVFAAIAGLFVVAKTGGTTNTMGTNMEIEVVMGIFLGGVLVTGGYSAKIEKLIIGSVTISIIKNGMVLIGLTSTQVTESARGIVLMLILFITVRLSEKEIGGKKIQQQKLNTDHSAGGE